MSITDKLSSLSLKTKIIVTVLLLFLTSIWTLTLFVSKRLEQDMTAQIESQQLSTASYIADSIEGQVKLRLETLAEIASLITPQLISNPRKLREFLNQRHVLKTLFRSGLTVISKEGKGIADYPVLPGRSTASYADIEFFKDISSTLKPAVGRPRIGRFSRVASIAFGVPILDRTSQLIGVLTATTALSDPALLGAIETASYKDFPDRLILVSPRYRIIITGSDPARIMAPSPKTGLNPVSDKFWTGFEGSGIAVNSRGVKMLLSAKQIPTPGWFIRVGLPAEIAFAPIKRMKFWAYSLAFGLSTLSSLLLWLLIRQTLSPLSVASKLIQDITDNHLPLQKIPVTRHDEVGQLLTSFNAHLDYRRQAEEENLSLQERLQRAEKMEALGKLAGGVAHDLNNVLGVLSGYSELLLERLPEGSPLKGYAANILKSSEKGATIIQDLLTLARRGVVVEEIINLNSTVASLLTSPEFKNLQNYHPQVTIKTDLAEDLFNIKGSPVHLEKTAMNLVSNAAEAVVGRGEVHIRTENRYLDRAVRGYDQVKQGDYVILTVSDTGGGIDTADLPKIFEPFYTKKSMGRSGTGLGLAIVWGTVKDHQGYIDVQSMEGKGTAFALYFPVTREKVSEPLPKLPLQQYRGLGESILIVDDVDEQRKVAASMLETLGYKVNAVSSGEEAVEYLKNRSADLLVLDMIMAPGIDGLDTYQRILEINPKQKAILVSGFSETDRVTKAQSLGAGPYVKKPYMMEKIGLAIRSELARN